MTRRARIALILFAAVALIALTLLPRRALHTEPPPPQTVRGAFHIHSNRSDGSGGVDAIAAAAAAAGLQFIIVTDHGDGTRAPDPPAYRSGVLVLDGIELNTAGGHYAVIGLPQSPYPLAGTAADVIEDVRRLGGFGFAAHPGSPRPSLSWQDWAAPIDGLEWLNADSEWRDEPRLPIARALLAYLLRAPESMATLLDYPTAVMQQWDSLSRSRPVVGLAGADAHARLALRERGDPDGESVHIPLPAYDASFRTFSNHVVLDAPLSGDAAADARRLQDAIRAGRTYSVIDALASPGSLTFTASSGSRSAQLGEGLPIENDVSLRASVSGPPGTTLVLLRNGQRVQQVTDGVLDTSGGKDPGAYRIEAYTAHAPGGPAVPWIVSNPIYAGIVMQPNAPAGVAEPVSRIPARTAEASAESGPRDTSNVTADIASDPLARTFAGEPGINWDVALAGGQATGQFAAASLPIAGGVAGFERVRFVVSSAAPMRVWVQLRAPVGNTERWGATFYSDSQPRTIDIAFARFNAIGVTSSPRPPLDRVNALLFVVDTLNTLPGTKGSLKISEVGFVK
jgi:hypothetical protein